MTIYAVNPAGLIESGFGSATGLRNFEALVQCQVETLANVPVPLVHFWCDNSNGNSWHKGAVVCPNALATAPIIESGFRASKDNVGNFETLVLEPGNLLVHYWRDNSDPLLPWHRGVVVSDRATGPAALIESSFAGPSLVTEPGFPFDSHPTPPGNFEALVLEGRELVHYWRDNSKAQVIGLPGEPKQLPWIRGAVVTSTATGGAAFFESGFRSSSDNPGNFEALILEGTDLVHYWRDNSDPLLPWLRGVVVSRNADGAAGFAQGYFRASTDNVGNFEVLVPESAPYSAGTLVHYWRDNSDPALPWHKGVTVSTLGAYTMALMVSYRVTEQPLSLTPEQAVGWNLEALGPRLNTNYLQPDAGGDNQLVHFWRDNSDYPTLPWNVDIVEEY
jgi:hypothetical protein